MALLTQAAMTGFREYVKRTVSYARYKMNGSYVKTELSDVTVDSSGVVRISFMIYPKTGTETVTEVQLYDTSGNLWLSQAKNLTMKSVGDGFYELVKFPIVEVDEE